MGAITPERAERADDSQPLPEPGQQPVAAAVIQDVVLIGEVTGRARVARRITAEIERRIEIGIKRYGTPLQTFNGRNALLDSMEEALDCVNYLKQLSLEKPRDGKVRLWYMNAVALALDLGDALYAADDGESGT